MFKKLFGKKEEPTPVKNQAPSNPAQESLMRAIAEKKKEDPLIGVKIGATEYLNQLLSAMKVEGKGVRIEDLLALLGSIGGFTCQISARLTNKAPQIMEVTTSDGKKFYIGDDINKPLLENPDSLWAFAGGGAQAAGAKTLLDINELAGHVVQSMGTSDFGIARVPKEHQSSEPLNNYIRFLWPQMPGIFNTWCDTPAQWPMLVGMTINKAIIMAKDTIAPEMALKLVMECAVPMSKIDPSEYLQSA